MATKNQIETLDEAAIWKMTLEGALEKIGDLREELAKTQVDCGAARAEARQNLDALHQARANGQTYVKMAEERSVRIKDLEARGRDALDRVAMLEMELQLRDARIELLEAREAHRVAMTRAGKTEDRLAEAEAAWNAINPEEA